MSDLMLLVSDLVSVAKTVAFAHVSGVIHRDLTSDNMIIGGNPLHGTEIRMRSKGGGFRWISWTVSPVPDEDWVCVIGRDIHHHHRQNQEWTELFETAPVPWIVTDHDGRIRQHYLLAEDVFGYEPEKIVGGDLSVLVDGWPADFDREVVETTHQLTAKTKEGAMVDINVRASHVSMEDGDLISIVIQSSGAGDE